MSSILNAFFPLGSKISVIVGIIKNDQFDLCVNFVKNETVSTNVVGFASLCQENGQVLKFLKGESENVSVVIPHVDVLLVHTSPRKIVLKSKKSFTTVSMKLNHFCKLIDFKNCITLQLEELSRRVSSCDIFYNFLVRSTIERCLRNEQEIAAMVSQYNKHPISLDAQIVKVHLAQHKYSDERIVHEIIILLEKQLINDVIQGFPTRTNKN